MLILAIIKIPLEQFFFRIYEPLLPEKKFPFNSSLRRTKAEMSGERVYRLLIYIVKTLATYIILKDSKFLTPYLGGSIDSPNYYANYPCILDEPQYLDSFYLISLSYNVFESIYACVYNSKRYDFSEILLHHLVTFGLISYSYFTKKLPLGAVTMLLMDASDIFVSLFKLTVDIFDKLTVLSYTFMLLAWLYFRMFLFPVEVIMVHYGQALSNDHPM
jgi:ceramide synthetase